MKKLSHKAQWIWDASNTRPNDFVVFRCAFPVESLPGKAVAHIAAETKYWLWINGALAVFEGGLFRESLPGAGYADAVDLAPFLRAGENTLTVLVWYHGNGGRNSKRMPGAGFLFDCDALGIHSGEGFRCLRHPAYYTPGAPRPAHLYGGDNVGFDGGKDFGAYWESDFDDSGFAPCTAYDGKAFGDLYERPVPLLRVEKRAYCEAVTYTAPNVYSAALPHACAVVPCIEVVAQGGEVLDIRTDRYAVNGGPGDGSIYKAHRLEYVCKQGVNVFEGLQYLFGEHLIVTASAPVEIRRIGYRETGYDCTLAGSFVCSDPLLNRLVEKAARTLYVCMRDNFMDCPDRERGQWIGDVSVQLPQVMFLLDRNARLLAKKCISDFIHLRRGSVLVGNVPGEHSGELPSQSLCAISEWGLVAQYYKYTGDKEALEWAFEPMVQYLMLWETGENGLIQPRSGDWAWFDHGYNADALVLENAWYYSALRFAEKCAGILEDRRFDAFLRARIDGISAAFHNAFYKKSCGCYSSAGMVDDRANAMAVLAGLAQPETFPDLRRVLLSVFNATVYMEYFVLAALCEMGYIEDAYKRMMSRYYNLAVNENTTLWEDFFLLGTKNHAWSGAPAAIAFRYFLGADTQDGGGTWDFHPYTGLFSKMEGVFETASERIRAEVDGENVRVEKTKI